MSSIILGEIGESFPLINGNDFINTIESLIPEYKFSLKDIIIIDQRGINLENIYLENDNKDNKLYLFSKKENNESILKTIDIIIKKMISSLSFPISINQNNLPDIHANYNLLEKASSFLKYIEPTEIKNTFEKMLEFFENFKIIYSTMKVNNNLCEKIKENYQNQYYGINILIKHINSISENCDKSRQDVINEYNKMIEIKDRSIKLFNESIEKLKITEIHPKMQTSNKKYLIDLYYDKNKMLIWKEQCLKDSSDIFDSIKEKTGIFFNESNKIRNENSTTIPLIKNEISTLSSDFDNKFNEYENKPIIILNELSGDFLEFKKALITIVDILTVKIVDIEDNKNIIEINDKNFDEACNNIKNLKIKYNSFNILTNLQNESDQINDLTSKMRKGLEDFSLKINKIFITFLEIENNLLTINQKFIHLKKRILNLNETFIQIQNPSYFPKAYQASVEEIKRRITFNNSLNNDLNLLKKQIKNENENRKIFIQNYGKYLPLEFFPCLKFTEVNLSYEIQNGNELSQLPDLLTEEDLEKTNFGTNNFCLIVQNEYNKSNKNDTQNNFDKKNYYEKILQFLQNEYLKTEQSFEKLSENFHETLSIKERELREKKFECDNLSKFINNKTNNKLENCPMCYESALKSKEYTNWDSFVKDLKKKLNEKELIIKQLESKYKSLVTQTNQMKKTFFNHMNTMISQKNSEIQNKIKDNKINFNSSHHENEILKLKDLNNNLISDNKFLQDEYKKLEKKYDLIKNKYDITLKENQGNKKEKEIILQEKEKVYKKLLQFENLIKISQSENNELKQNKNTLNNQIEILGKEIQNIKKQYNEEISTYKKKLNEINIDNFIQYKNLSKGKRCIFVPQSEGIYACINLSEDLFPNDQKRKDKFFKCNYLLDMSSFDEDMKKLIVENSLIVIGVIGEYTEYNTKKNNNPLNLPESNFNNNSSVYQMIKLKEVNYIIGFPGEELIFRNYNKLSFDDTI
jgi:hypothetical protein